MWGKAKTLKEYMECRTSAHIGHIWT
jgi:hypothetical protein